MILLLAFCLLFQSIFAVASQEQLHHFEKELAELNTLRGDEFREAVITIYVRLDGMTDINTKNEITRRVFEITKNRDEQAHIWSLAYPVIYPDSVRLQYLKQAFQSAKKIKSVGLMAWVEDRRCRFFIEHNQLDSAMFYLLKIRDLYQPKENSEDFLNINHLLGDIYYNSGLFKQAEEIYTEIFKVYDKQENYNYWRTYVIMNNLGQIGLKTQNYATALHWFTKSLNLAESFLTLPEKTNIIAYIHIKLSETQYESGDLDKAKLHLGKAGDLPEDLIYSDVKQDYLYAKSRILLAENEPLQALETANELAGYDTLNRVSFRFGNEINLLFSEIYRDLNEPETSLHFLEIQTAINDSIRKQGNIARSLLVFTEKEHQEMLNKLESSNQVKRNLIFVVSLLILILITISYLYRKLYLSKLLLVNKALEKKHIRELGEVRSKKNGDTNLKEEDLVQLANQLQDLMEKEKIFLDQNLNIQKMAQLLGTNRTYLSNAINVILESNFPNYINELRIRESIRLISEGFTQNQTQEALAKQSGFGNRTVFITAFKKYTGVTPSFFINNFKTIKKTETSTP